MTEHRNLKSSNGVTLSEHTLTDGRNVLSRAYTVKSRRTPEVPNFGTMAEAETYYEQELLRVLNPKK